jgi:hypothetical protein
MKRKYAVMDFDPDEGMHFYGVFDTPHEAKTWGAEVIKGRMTWFVVDIMDHEYAAQLAN